MHSNRPYDPELSAEDRRRILACTPLASLAPSLFPGHQPLEKILRQHARVRGFRRAALIVREGDYGSSAFVVLRGQVRVILNPPLPADLLGRRSERKLSPWQALAQLWRQDREPEQRHALADDAGTGLLTGDLGRREIQVMLPDLDTVIAGHRTVELGTGEMFGEIAALTRSPRGATIVADSDCELVEIRWQGLRLIRRYAPPFRENIDALFRKRGLRQQLRLLPLFSALPLEDFNAVVEAADIEAWGNEVWYEDQTAEQDEPVVCAPGTAADALWLVQGGFARIIGDGPVTDCTEGFLRPGELFGLDELVRGWRTGRPQRRRQGFRALGTLDLLRIPLAVLEQHVFGRIDEALLPAPDPLPGGGIETKLLDFLVDHRYLNGRAGMLIDLDRCVRCDDCVRACAGVHQGNPRFVRDGRRHGRYMVAHACMHCVDPVCLVGCPTGAIFRSALDGRVLISETSCIGCSTCADSCPYGNIRMIELRADHGRALIDEASGAPLRKASSCDLCAEQRAGPACQTACPYDALIRVDIGDSEALRRWMTP